MADGPTLGNAHDSYLVSLLSGMGIVVVGQVQVSQMVFHFC